MEYRHFNEIAQKCSTSNTPTVYNHFKIILKEFKNAF